MLIIGLLALGLLAGILGGMLGIGGGAVMVPLLVLAFGFTVHDAVGTSLAVIIPLAMAGALTHYELANVHPEAAGIMAVGAILGAVLGAQMAEAIPAEFLGKIFGVALLVIGAKMIAG
ncbi:hypothetical protein AKJ53_00715 [candidate division MSBL1 archaeon SCGC-AAA382F02]|uniref:Probable membrane transporter protein n=1 Tax=candidate division MSBL1 archaeon SCGC-AAA382F02 TaxID=1698282 RepID=A0A133VIN6_9EURY|nr:hypothetical protein AKJ53_00715 [candidate division MSBL1 archaeon SCGC-AAA382F02]